MDDTIEGTPDLPKFLHSERVNLGIRGADPLPLEPALGKETPSPLCEHCHPRSEVRGGLATGAFPILPSGHRAHPHDPFVTREQ